LRDPLGQHLAEGTAGIMFEMPFRRHHMGKEPVQFLRVIDQFFEQAAQIPLIQHIADIKDDRIDFGNGSFPYQKVAFSPGVP